MQMYLELIDKMKEYDSSEELDRIEKSLLETKDHMNKCFFNEKKTTLFIERICHEYKEDFEELSYYLKHLDNGGTNVYHKLFNISYNLFRLAAFRILNDKTDNEIREIINNTNQVLFYELQKIVD